MINIVKSCREVEKYEDGVYALGFGNEEVVNNNEFRLSGMNGVEAFCRESRGEVSKILGINRTSVWSTQ